MLAVDPAKRDEYLARLMQPPNTIWAQILQQAQANPDVLKQPEVIKSLQNVLQTNVSLCSSLGSPYLSQMVQMADSMLQVIQLGWCFMHRQGSMYVCLGTA
jgi:exportin-1